MSDKARARSDWPLTPRQLECLERFWSRNSAKEIAIGLGISHHAVEKHLQGARQSLGVSTSIEAARLVFGDPRDPTVKPYYDPSEVPVGTPPSHTTIVPERSHAVAGMAGEHIPINTFGPGLTMLAILAVAIGSILAVAALVAAAQGVNQLWWELIH